MQKDLDLKKSFLDIFFFLALPLHLWSYWLLFTDLSGVAAETDFVEAIGFGAYVLLNTLLESLMVAVFFWLAFLLLEKFFSAQKSLAAAKALGFVLLLFAMAGQYYYQLNNDIGSLLFRIEYHLARLGWVGLIGLIVGIFIAVALPTVFTLRKQPVAAWINRFTERVQVVAQLYIAVDVLAIILIIFRNL